MELLDRLDNECEGCHCALWCCECEVDCDCHDCTTSVLAPPPS